MKHPSLFFRSPGIPAALCAASAMSAAAQQPSEFRQPELPPWQPVSWIDTIPRDNDDRPCEIASIELSARVDGVFARVSETLVIRNPNGRQLSAPIVFPLPDGAAVCGYALDIDGVMVDGVAVPREKARVAFETEQRRGIDPGLAEAVKGNVWRTRVYPVPANGTRRLRVDWTAPLAIAADGASAALSLPMPDARLDKRTVTVEVSDLSSGSAPVLGGFGDTSFFAGADRVWRAQGAETNLAPRSDLLIALPRLPDRIACVEEAPDGGGAWFCVSARTSPTPPPREAPAPAAFTVFWDVSGSRAASSREADLAVLRALPAQPAGQYRLVAFRDAAGPERVFSTVEELAAAAAAEECDGGTDFEALAAAIAEAAKARPDEVFHLFTDGLDTLSGKPIDFGPEATGRVVAFASGAERDAESLRQACGGLVFDPADAAAVSAAAASGFKLKTVLSVHGDGVSEVQGVGGDASRRATVLGRVSGGAGSTVTVRAGEETFAFSIDPSAAQRGSTVATAWAVSRVAALSPRAADNEEELLALSRRFGVASPAASFIVLESLDQWLRHDIEPPASLPELREKWTEARKGRMGALTPEASAERHLEHLLGLWDAKMEWWRTDWSTVKPPKKEKPEGSGNAPVGVVRSAARALFGMRPGSGVARSASVEDYAPADGLAAPAAAGMVMEEAAPMAPGTAANSAERKSGTIPDGAATTSTIAVKPWSPDVPYLKALDKAADPAAARAEYMRQRREWAASPAFFLDCAGWFFDKGDGAFAVRVISNLAELRIEDPALLRVMAWRLRQGGAFDRAAVALRRVCALRPEEGQSWRDLALTLDSAARAAAAGAETGAGGAKTREQVLEALSLYRKVALTPWNRHAFDLAVFAVEEHNALLAWAAGRGIVETGGPGAPEPLPDGLRDVPDCDVRVVMSWDADETDVDLHVTEPTGEEAYYGHRRTRIGGDVSRDITDGYGPEEYMLRKARKGAYAVRAHYFASHRQEVFGQATVTAEIFTDWGRPGQASQTLSIRLDKEKRMLDLGKVDIN